MIFEREAIKLKLLTFKGGIHFDDKKSLTNKKPIEILPAPDFVTIPLSQHIGAPCEPLVSVSDHVYMGQKIGDSEAPMSTPVHASVSGEVVEITDKRSSNQKRVTCIVIKNDFKDTLDPSIAPFGDLDSLTPGDIKHIVRECGLVGSGGATFPTHIKLSPPPDKKIDCIILNGAECEPYLTSDHRTMLEDADKVIFGLLAFMKALGVKKAYIGVEANKQDAILALKKAKKDHEEINITPLKTKYPQGAEKQLIYAILKRVVPSGKLPADVGVVVNNVDTAVRLCDAIKLGMPVITRVVTVSGGAVKNPKNLRVRIGTLFSHLFDYCGGLTEEPYKILSGGPMMGIAEHKLSIPVIKGTSGALAITKNESFFGERTPCLSCGKCINACPMHLFPNVIANATLSSDFVLAKESFAMDCIECGSCAYVCPAKNNPVELIRKAKDYIRTNKL